jgi:hypothetical protein
MSNFPRSTGFTLLSRIKSKTCLMDSMRSYPGILSLLWVFLCSIQVTINTRYPSSTRMNLNSLSQEPPILTSMNGAPQLSTMVTPHQTPTLSGGGEPSSLLTGKRELKFWALQLGHLEYLSMAFWISRECKACRNSPSIAPTVSQTAYHRPIHVSVI